MKSMFFPCHMCGSYDSEVLTPAFLADGSFCDFQKIVICRKCGLVYKNPVVPGLNKLVYSKQSWDDGTIFRKHVSELMVFLSDHLKKTSPKTIVEVGPGPGWLAMAIKEILPNSKYLLFEASEDVAQLTAKNMPDAMVIPASIEEIQVNDHIADFAVVSGVDYLFSDFRSAINKIHSMLNDDGYVYIARNVFVDTEAYARSPIRTYDDLFGKNVLMTTWFSASQYKQFLQILFDVVSEQKFLLNETDDYKSVIHAFVCKKKAANEKYYNGNMSWYDSNMASLGRLVKKTHDAPERKVLKEEGVFQRAHGLLRRVIKQGKRD